MRNLIERKTPDGVDDPPACTHLPDTQQPVTRRAWLGALAAIAGGGALSVLAAERLWAAPLGRRLDRAPLMAYVYAAPSRTCCGKWVGHLERNGFAVTTEALDDVIPFKEKFGVPRELWSCHTALVDDYVIEGHVPADLIRRLRDDPRGIAGLSVPGMPCGAPGLEGPNPQKYQVMAFTKTGESFVFAER